MEIRNVEFFKDGNGFVIEWSKEGVGFGQLTFDGGKIDSECMGEDFCKEVFDAFIKKYLQTDTQDAPSCKNCRWWGKMPHVVNLDGKDYELQQIQREYDDIDKKTEIKHKHCLKIEELGVDSMFIDTYSDDACSATVITPSNFKCSLYLRMQNYYHYEGYVQGICEQFEKMCNLTVNEETLRLTINGGCSTILFRDKRDNPIVYLIEEKKFQDTQGKESGEKRKQAVKWLMENTMSYEQFKFKKQYGRREV